MVNELSVFQSDNASDNNTLVECFIEIFNLSAKEMRMWYLGHIINLIVKACLFGEGFSKLETTINDLSERDQFEEWYKYRPIQKLYNIMLYIL